MKQNHRRTWNVVTILMTIAIIGLTIVMSGCTDTAKSRETEAEVGVDSITLAEARAIAKEAYIYGFPIIMNYKTMYQYAIDKKNPEYKGPFNQLSCEARLFTPDDKAVVTPNSDTPYCMFWMDLRAEPLVLSVPEMEEERYYSFQLIDFYTHNFAYIGTLTTGNGEGRYLLAGPGWDGKKPNGITDVIKSETDFIFNVTRTQLFGPDDMKKVKMIQSQYGLQPLSAFLGIEAPAAPAMPNFPEWVEGSQFDERFFSYLDFVMDLLKKPGQGEETLWDDLARLNIGPGKTFRMDALSDEQAEALKAGLKDGFADMEAFIAKNASDPLVSGKIFGTREFLNESAKKNYNLDKPDMPRAVAAHLGLYGNSAAEAIYPTYLTDAEGQPMDGSAHSYTITFQKGQLPPVKAFWSLSMYDGKTQLFIENQLDRYLLNSDMMDQFKLEEDGSLVLHIGKDSPGKDLEPNWLPAPDGPFYLVMRLYGPEKTALEGRWTPPKVRKAGGLAGESKKLVSVNVANFVRAESDNMIRANMAAFGVDFGQFAHLRKPMQRAAAADLKFWINGKEAAQGKVQRTVPAVFTASETFDVGMDTSSPVADDYFNKAPFKFEGSLNKLHFRNLPVE